MVLSLLDEREIDENKSHDIPLYHIVASTNFLLDMKPFSLLNQPKTQKTVTFFVEFVLSALTEYFLAALFHSVTKFLALLLWIQLFFQLPSLPVNKYFFCRYKL